ncbi:hypothetical protein MNBD_ACTINO01-1432 [hydrothermal vent metagenome]|uniref:RNA polymerase sigma-70 region 2 domain-containing protein n=1 Tax=hydrothermal vent metagenome TaxID=652676 RepID=A0A3B0SLM4_9ZZZZ
MAPIPSAETSDSDLVLACQRGDMEAFEALYRSYFSPVYDFAVRTMKDRHSAADVVQDAFIKAHAKIGQLRNPEAFRPWLYAIVRREALNRFRDQARESVTSTLEDNDRGVNPLLSEVTSDPTHDPVATAELSDSAALVWEAAASLDADTYTVLDLHVRKGLTSAEIANVLGISKGNAYTKVNRMKERTGAAISAYLLIRKGSKDCTDLARIVAPESLPPVTAKLRRAVERHTRTCDACDERRRALVAPMSIFAALAAVAPPVGLEDAIWQNVSGAPSGGAGHHPRRKWIPVALAVLLIVLIGSATGVGIALVSRNTGTPLAAPVTTTVPPSETTSPDVAVDAPDITGTTPTTTPVATTTSTTSTPSTTTTTPATTGTPTTTATVATTVAPTTTATTTTVPPATTTTTTTPDTSPPLFGQDTTNPVTIWELDTTTITCPVGTERVATISIDVTDTGTGVESVTASWIIGGTPDSATMTATGDTYTAPFGPFPYPTVPDSTTVAVSITITARDFAGNQSTTITTVTVTSLADCFI